MSTCPIDDKQFRILIESKGTRLHIYKWLDILEARKKGGDREVHSLPVLKTEKKWTKKVHPGPLSTDLSTVDSSEQHS